MKQELSSSCFLNQHGFCINMMRCLTKMGVVILIVLSLFGCGKGKEDDPPPPDITEKVEKATIRIEATVGDSLFGGSGFIIDSAGIAVTNNHVVTGAGIIEVFLRDEQSGRIATLLGYSECSDLAIIDFTNGEVYEKLDWYGGIVSANMAVKSVGYPLRAQTPIWKEGTISSSPFPRDTSWASIGKAIEHSAKINAGSSGGPLVDVEGRVVGINYAGNSQLDVNLAIAANEAKQVVGQLRNGTQVARYESIGINGEATDSGIEVRSVLENSPADNIGMMTGDTIKKMRSIPLDTGDMNEYCKVIKSNPKSVVAIEVARSGQTLTGKLDMDNMGRGENLKEEDQGEDGSTTLQGELSSTDEKRGDESYFDMYGVTAIETGRAEISMQVDNFTPYISILSSPDLDTIERGISPVSINVTAGTIYFVLANSLSANKTGSYTITFDRIFSNIKPL